MTIPLGLHLSFTRTTPLPERLCILRDAGFDSTALWWEHQRPEIRALRDRAPEMVRSAGLDLDHIHVPYFACNELWSENDTEREAAFALHRGWVEDCGRHAIPRMVMHVSRGRSAPPPHAAALDDFRGLADLAERTGVVIALENTHLPGHLHALFEHIESPALGLCYDIAHDRLHSGAPLALLRRWRDRVAALHVSDTDGRRDWHWLPGAGNTDFAAVGACLGAEGFAGALMLESMMGRDEASVPDFAARAFEAAQRVRDAIAGTLATTTAAAPTRAS